MKKEYSKPIVVVESFEISEFVAGDCTKDVGFGDTGASKMCSILDIDTGYTVFNSYGVCESLWEDGDDKGCYHIPDGGVGYFGS